MEFTGRWVFSGQPVRISVQDGVIASIHHVEEHDDTAGAWIAPGFWDLQVNGYQGYDYSGPDLDDRQMTAVMRLLAAAGTTHHVPTIVTSSNDRITRNVRVIRDARGRSAALEAAIPMIHLEGPYISGLDGHRGAHDPQYVRDPSYDEFTQWKEASGGLVRMVTLAPERKGALEFIERLSGEGIIVAVGHTAAEPSCVREAIAAGARLSTHLGNGSPAMLPRLSNFVWEQLAADELWAGIIADGFHLPPAVLRVFSRAKGLSRLVLVSDVAVCGGYPPGRYRWGQIEVEVYPDGHLGLAGTEYLAGAGHLLDRCVAQFARHSGHELSQVIALVTDNPARLLGVPGPGTLTPQPGAPADLVQFRWRQEAERLCIEHTVLGAAGLHVDAAE